MNEPHPTSATPIGVAVKNENALLPFPTNLVCSKQLSNPISKNMEFVK
jgi:hypothetical protein